MEEFKTLIFNFLTLYDKPIINIEFLGSQNYREPRSRLGESECVLDYDEVKVNVNGFSDAVEYYKMLMLSKQKIIERLWHLQDQQRKSFQSTVLFTLSLLNNSSNNFEKEKSDISFAYLPPDSPKWMIQEELIYNKKEEKFYIQTEKRSHIPVKTDERKCISVYYYFMIEILEDLITFLENIQTIKRDERIKNSFELTYSDQSLVDFKNSLKSKGYIEDTDIKLFTHIFTGKEINYKINWTGGKELLKFFINVLVSEGYVKPVWEKWKITASCFLIDGNEIDTLNLATQQKPKGISQESISNIFENLKKTSDSKSNV